jgi:predicted nucleic acid-binding protein
MRLLLDTNVLIDASKQREPARSWLEQALRQPNQIGVCAVTVAEFFAGILPAERLRWDTFVAELTYWVATREIAQQAGTFRYEYLRRGRTIQIPDALIAATAMAVEAVVVTNNAKDFPMPEIKTIQLLRR